MTKCQRCGADTTTHIVSYFNTDTICLSCSDLEQHHPEFAAARSAEIEEVRRGNYNFSGVGVPLDLVALSKAQRARSVR